MLIREGGDRPPLFLVHDGDGETMLYRNLALRLKTDHAVYGLQPYPRPGVPMAHTRIAEMAAYHIDKIRSVQPHGPYLLGGMCAGGVIAFEIARQLQDQGEKVALVALLDAADAEAPSRPGASPASGSSVSAACSARRPGPAGPPRADGPHPRQGEEGQERGGLHGRGTPQTGEGRGPDEAAPRPPRPRPSPARLLEKLPVRTIYLFAERDYRPDGRFDGELPLFRATSGVGTDEPYVESYDDPLLGWRRRAYPGGPRLRRSRRPFEHAPGTRRRRSWPSRCSPSSTRPWPTSHRRRTRRPWWSIASNHPIASTTHHQLMPTSRHVR